MTALELRPESDRRRTQRIPLPDEEAGLTAKDARERRKEARIGDGGRRRDKKWEDGRVQVGCYRQERPCSVQTHFWKAVVVRG